jgi:hypothetical protein
MTMRLVHIQTALWCVLFLLPAAAAEAQQPRLPRADASASVGWLHADVSDLSEPYDTWASRRATLNGQVGLYWTEHWKSEVGAERSNTQDRWESVMVPQPGGEPAFRVSEHHIQDTRVSIGQFYQFGHNSWTHVSLGGGVNVTRRSTVTDIQPVTRYDRTGMVVLEPGSRSSSADTDVNAFTSVAFKAYMTPRVFMRSDVQTDFRKDLQAVVLRIGVGADF